MVNAKRLRYEAGADDKGRYAPTPHGPSNTLMTHIWRDGLERVKNRLYIKELDQGQSVQRPSVRLETRLGMTACGDMGLGRAWQFGEFGVNLRRVLSPYFYIADSIKPKFKRMRHKEGTRIAQETAKANQREIDKVTNGWRTQGAMWAVKHGYAVVPNKQAHKRIGDALHRLGRQLTALKPSEKSRAPDRWIPAESLEFLDVPD
jgi:hypothetical protein